MDGLTHINGIRAAARGGSRLIQPAAFAGRHEFPHVQFGPIRQLYEDRVVGGAGSVTHSHLDMEILTYVLEGALCHRDSLGNSSVIQTDDVQRMSAGTGVSHSEWNHSDTNELHYLQVWIRPATLRITPSYQQKNFPAIGKHNRFRLIASHNDADDSLSIHQDVKLFAGVFDGVEPVVLRLGEERRAYVYIARGEIRVNGLTLTAGDAIKMARVERITVALGQDAEVLVFSVPGRDDGMATSMHPLDAADND